MRGEGDVAGEGRLGGEQKFYSWQLGAPDEYAVRLDVCCFHWSSNYITFIHYVNPLLASFWVVIIQSLHEDIRYLTKVL